MNNTNVTPLHASGSRYFVTGATGFIGRFLVPKLIERNGQIHLLVRESQGPQIEALLKQWQAAEGQIQVIYGDLAEKNLGLNDEHIENLKGNIDHFFHLAAIYDINADEESQMKANVEGTRNTLALAETLKVGRFHYFSSIAVAGLYEGTFKETMLDEAGPFKNPYLKTKHLAERVVQNECTLPWRIYRPGMVIGHSRTGEITKADGPYYLFPAIRKLRNSLPQWLPLIGIEGGYMNLVPVDYLVDSVDHIAHKDNFDNQCFHITDPAPRRLGQLLSTFYSISGAPRMAFRIDSNVVSPVMSMVLKSLLQMPAVTKLSETILQDLKIPTAALDFINFPTTYDRSNTDAALEGSGIRLPNLEEYASVLWHYWDQHLNEERINEDSLAKKIKDKVVLITGAASGIGLATAMRLSTSGAHLVLFDRDEENLAEVAKAIRSEGGKVSTWNVDLTSEQQCNNAMIAVNETLGGVDVLINNAGRSIRRAINNSYDRFHDFERCMDINYYGAMRMIMGCLPKMEEKKYGQVINISSIGVLAGSPRFSAYVASKGALDAFSRCASAEYADKNVVFTTINMPLVRTPMIAPTKLYQNVPTLTPDEAADLIVKAIIRRPSRIATRMGLSALALYETMPRLSELMMSTSYNMFEESKAALGKEKEEPETNEVARERKPSPEQRLLMGLLKGIQW